MKQTCELYEKIFKIEKKSESALKFLRIMAVEGIFVKLCAQQLLEQLKESELNTSKASAPVMQNYYEKMKNKIPISCSIAEVEYNSNLEGEIAFYQNLWDTMVVSTTQTLIGKAVAGF